MKGVVFSLQTPHPYPSIPKSRGLHPFQIGARRSKYCGNRDGGLRETPRSWDWSETRKEKVWQNERVSFMERFFRTGNRTFRPATRFISTQSSLLRWRPTSLSVTQALGPACHFTKVLHRLKMNTSSLLNSPNTFPNAIIAQPLQFSSP